MKNPHVIVVDHDPGWPAAFASEAAELRVAIRAGIVAIHHIGSTAVPGLAAKPIIDILLEVDRVEDLDPETDALRSIGYHALGEYGMPGRRYFVKGAPMRTHQVHAFGAGDPNVARHLAFRDYLRAHPDAVEQYGALKRGLAASCEHDIDAYMDGKDAWVTAHEAKALAWRGLDAP